MVKETMILRPEYILDKSILQYSSPPTFMVAPIEDQGWWQLGLLKTSSR